MTEDWTEKPDRFATYRLWLTVTGGTIILFLGIHRSDSAMIMVGGGLVGFSPAAKGP